MSGNPISVATSHKCQLASQFQTGGSGRRQGFSPHQVMGFAADMRRVKRETIQGWPCGQRFGFLRHDRFDKKK
jgi:hypothetical protein